MPAPADMLLFCDLRKPVLLGGANAEKENRSALDLVLQAREQPGAWIDVARAFSWDLPMWIAHGMVDSIELANSHLARSSVQTDEAGGKPRDKQAYPNPTGIGRWNAAIYYHLLNCGLRFRPRPAAAPATRPTRWATTGRTSTSTASSRSKNGGKACGPAAWW